MALAAGQRGLVQATASRVQDGPLPPNFPATGRPYEPNVVLRADFARAIAGGTPLHRVVRLDMHGTFTMNGRDMPMRFIIDPKLPASLDRITLAYIFYGQNRLAAADLNAFN